MVGARGWERGADRELVFNGSRVSLSQNEKSGGDRTAVMAAQQVSVFTASDLYT